MTIDKNKYIDISFFVLVFVLTTAFLKEFIFHSSSTISSGFAGLIGVGFSSIAYLTLKRFGIIPKVFVLLALISLIIIYSQSEEKKISSIEGVWITNNEDSTIKVEFIENHLKMLLSPSGNSRVFEYEISGDSIEIYDDNENEYFVWEIKTLNKDKLIILENKETIINFKRE